MSKDFEPSDLYHSLFKTKRYSDATITINNIEYRVHKEILSETCEYFKTYFTTSLNIESDKNIEILNLLDETASKEIIDEVFKIIYSIFAAKEKGGEVKWQPVTRDNLFERLNILFILNFLILYELKVKNICNLDTFAKEFGERFKELLNHKINFKLGMQESIAINKAKEILSIFYPKLVNYYFPGYRDDIGNKNTYLNIINPYYVEGIELPVFPNVERIEKFQIKAFANILNIDERLKFLAPLIDFKYEFENALKLHQEYPNKIKLAKMSVIEQILDFSEYFPDVNRYLMALYSFTKLEDNVKTQQ